MFYGKVAVRVGDLKVYRLGKKKALVENQSTVTNNGVMKNYCISSKVLSNLWLCLMVLVSLEYRYAKFT